MLSVLLTTVRLRHVVLQLLLQTVHRKFQLTLRLLVMLKSLARPPRLLLPNTLLGHFTRIQVV